MKLNGKDYVLVSAFVDRELEDFPETARPTSRLYMNRIVNGLAGLRVKANHIILYSRSNMGYEERTLTIATNQWATGNPDIDVHLCSCGGNVCEHPVTITVRR